MAYITGTATSYADLLTALTTACIDAGFALNGDVLSKGTLFTEVIALSDQITVQGGIGQTAGVLTGRSDYQLSYLGADVITKEPTVSNPVTFPVLYDIHIHTGPDEVYLFINYNVNCYQYLCFGQSDMPGLPGTGNWYAATTKENAYMSQWIWGRQGYGYAFYWSCAPFDGDYYYGNSNGAVHHGFTEEGSAWQFNMSYPTKWPMIDNSPNTWNQESPLFPIQVFTRRPSGLSCLVMQMGHARWVMLDSLSDRQVVTIGSDSWMVYPLWRRGIRNMIPTGSSNAGNGNGNDSTGTMGWAIRKG